ncbi:lysozyme [uncultured Halomonas sp.]|uniref:lysozyme n=1 Tax=uncultured Halomonas sp. TaxID=173971 RepID=UPI00261FDD16|nr:lysozyme [uncultured Halomonas sp.]
MSIYNHLDASVEAPSGTPEKVSRRGLDLLHHFEGFREEAYLCPAGVWTIGYGNTKWPDGRPVRKGDRVTREEGEELFRTILRTFERGVLDAVEVELTQGQFDALVSFSYNVGLGALRSSTLLRLLNSGDYEGAADQFLRWNKAGGRVLNGLTRRREAERKLFKE